MASRYWPTRDTNLAKRFNDELVGNLKDDKCGIIGQEVILYRVSTYETETNMYGEAGGGKVYEEAMNKGLCEQIYLTRIHNDEIECDTFFPEVSEERFHLVSNGPMKTENGIKYEFLKYQEKEHEELQYLNLIKNLNIA